MADGGLELHQDHGIGPGDSVLCMAQVVVQSLTFVSTELTFARSTEALITQREDVVAKGWDGKCGALVRQVCGGANHSEGSWKGGRRKCVVLKK